MELGSFSNGSTGNTTIGLTTGSAPTYISFWIGPRSSTTESTDLRSTGELDITNAIATWQSNLSDPVHSQAQTVGGAGAATTTPCLTHYAVVSGAITKVVEMKFVSAAAGSFTVNLTVANSAYKIYFRATP